MFENTFNAFADCEWLTLSDARLMSQAKYPPEYAHLLAQAQYNYLASLRVPPGFADWFEYGDELH